MNSPGRTGPTDPLIYVVDDDLSIAKLVFNALQSRGYRCKPFYSGRTMLEELRNDRPNLIILDVMMPGIDGVTIARQVRNFSGVPIMMLSARSDTGVKATALNVGADDYLPKPFNPRELLARIRAILRRSAGEEATVAPAIVAGRRTRRRQPALATMTRARPPRPAALPAD